MNQVVINTLEHIPHMPTLLLGRFLGGLSTSLLFSSFEAWMVSEHKQLGYKEEWLQDTFAIASWGNGLMAIGAGLVAQVASGKIARHLSHNKHQMLLVTLDHFK